MGHLEELKSVLLLGTDRSSLSDELLNYLKTSGLNPADSQEKTAARALVSFRQWQRAGLKAGIGQQELPVAASAALPEQECDKVSAHCLQEILDGHYQDALEEWVDLLLEAKQVLPKVALPALFQRGLEDANFWEILKVAIGSRGEWLLQQNPAWQSLTTFPTREEDWGTSTGAPRIVLFRSIRKQDPLQGLQLLQTGWDTEDPAQKASLLAELSHGLSLQDEAFLENCLQDRRKETRQMAAELLACIPGSAFTQRYLGYLQECIRVQDQKIILHLPVELPETWRKDGVEIGGKAPFSFIQRSAWLFQLLRRLPPGFWQSHWGLTPLQCIALFAQQDREESWVQALTDASLLHHDQVWQEALAAWWLNNPGASSWQTASGRHMLQLLSAEALQRLVTPCLQKQEHLLADDQVATYLLCASNQPWDEALSLALIQPFKRYMASRDNPFWNIWHYSRLLKALAYHCPTELYSELNEAWDRESTLWQRWQAEVERMLAVVQFRAKMRKSFSSPA